MRKGMLQDIQGIFKKGTGNLKLSYSLIIIKLN